MLCNVDRRRGGQSPLPLTLQRRRLMCFKSDSLTGLSPGLQPRGLMRHPSLGYRKSRCESCLLRCCFLKSSYPGHREKIPDEQTLHRSLLLSLCSVHALDPVSLSLPKLPTSSFNVVHPPINTNSTAYTL